jgi:hypothetical protein
MALMRPIGCDLNDAVDFVPADAISRLASEEAMEIWELAARERVRETLALYAHYADRGKFAEMVALFADDGVLEIDGQPRLVGRSAIEEFLNRTKTARAQPSSSPLIRHHVSSITIRLLGRDEADAASYFLAITEHGPDHWGRYRDRLIRAGDSWLFAQRRVRLDGRR